MTDLFSGDPANERDEILAKWKDKPLEEVLKAKVESDLYIKTLERQKDELRADYLSQREELLAKANLQDLVDRLNTQTPPTGDTPKADGTREPKFDPKELETMISAKIEETRLVEKQTANIQQVQAKLREQYGDKFQSVLKDTGLSEKRINEIAAESPEAIYRLVGLTNTPKETFQTPTRSNLRNDNFAPKGADKRDWAYYQELKKTNPTLYLDNKIAVQMHDDLMSMGEVEFYGRN